MGVRSKGGRKPSSDANLFATDAEIANRTAPLYNWDPQESAPSFSQIPPKSGSGSVNRAPLSKKSGDFKWSGGIGKPQLAVNPGGTWPPIAGGVPGAAAPPGMAQAGDMGGGGGAQGGMDPMMLLAMARLARSSKIRNQQRNKKSKSSSKRKG